MDSSDISSELVSSELTSSMLESSSSEPSETTEMSVVESHLSEINYTLQVELQFQLLLVAALIAYIILKQVKKFM